MMRQILAVTLMGLLIAACQGLASIGGPGPTPDVPNYGSPPSMEDFPLQLNCSLITNTSPGPSIGGLQIGVSTYDDVRQRLDNMIMYWDLEFGNLMFENEPGYRPVGPLREQFVRDQIALIP